jgi:hypothetical protein
MKTKLLIFLFFGLVQLHAQTTHELNWFAGIGSNVDLTIETGDTVRWTWTSPNHTVENNPAGSSVETFDSGFLGPIGSTFSHTFTVEGSNDYFCGVHGAGNMSGTITVQDNLSTDDFVKEVFTILKNPSVFEMNISLSSFDDKTKVEVFDILGKLVFSEKITSMKPNINITEWSPGLYLVKVINGTGVQTKRFVKQ